MQNFEGDFRPVRTFSRLYAVYAELVQKSCVALQDKCKLSSNFHTKVSIFIQNICNLHELDANIIPHAKYYHPNSFQAKYCHLVLQRAFAPAEEACKCS